jgi:hypothetical protein
MRLSRSSARLARLLSLLGLVGAACVHSGCEEGMPPTLVVPQDGLPPDFLPDGVALGTSSFTDSLYYYDSNRFQAYSAIPGTDARFIRRGAVLSIRNATQDQIRNPTSIPGTDGDVLRDVYSRPYLFGFERIQSADPDPPGFRPGEFVEGSHQFWPLDVAGASWWEYNHTQFQWARKDTLRGTAQTSTGTARWLQTLNSLEACGPPNCNPATFTPNLYSSDLAISVTPGAGIFMHGWTLTAERNEEVLDFGTPRRQRNPTFLWVAQGALGQANPNASDVTSIDQCVDGLWGEVELFPVQMAGPDLQVGQRFVTWTYVTADPGQIFCRAFGLILSENAALFPEALDFCCNVVGNCPDPPEVCEQARSRGARCRTEREFVRCSGTGNIPEGIPMDHPAFPTIHMSVLARYDFEVAEVFDSLPWTSGQTTVGVYGAVDGIVDVVKFRVTVTLGAPVEFVAQQLDLYLMRGIGLVVQVTGISEFDISRLRQCLVDGQFFDQAFFQYRD